MKKITEAQAWRRVAEIMDSADKDERVYICNTIVKAIANKDTPTLADAMLKRIKRDMPNASTYWVQVATDSGEWFHESVSDHREHRGYRDPKILLCLMYAAMAETGD